MKYLDILDKIFQEVVLAYPCLANNVVSQMFTYANTHKIDMVDWLTETDFNHDINEMIYNFHKQFRQTNVLVEYLDDGDVRFDSLMWDAIKESSCALAIVEHVLNGKYEEMLEICKAQNTTELKYYIKYAILKGENV